MTMVNETIDRRRYERFSVPTNAFAFFGSRSAKLGQIVDISEGGLSFCYIPGTERPYNSYELDILLPGGTFYLNGVPFKTVSDYQFKSEGVLSGTRKCHVAFGPLSSKQQSELGYFIEYYATRQDLPSSSM